MVHLNKNLLTQDQLEKLLQQFNNTLSKNRGSSGITILTDLLGTEEKIMLAKRLGIIILLRQQCTIYKVSRSMKVSTSTVAKIQSQMEVGKYDNLISVISKKKNDYLAILNTLDSILHLGGILPHYGQRPKNLR